jgi:CopG family nickel-responsive transcriptional regulator
MAELIRTGVSIEGSLLAQFDRVIAKRGYQNRSEALRDLIRESLISEAVDENQPVVATLSMIYDHHRPNLANRLIEIQHHAHGSVLAATHVHLDEANCLEVVIMKGRSGELKQLADHMLSMRGVKHGKLVLTTAGNRRAARRRGTGQQEVVEERRGRKGSQVGVSGLIGSRDAQGR